MEPEDLLLQETYRPLSMESQALVTEMCGELVDFTHFVWFNKVTRTWDRFGPGSTFMLFEDGRVEVDV